MKITEMTTDEDEPSLEDDGVPTATYYTLAKAMIENGLATNHDRLFRMFCNAWQQGRAIGRLEAQVQALRSNEAKK